uniref:Hypothetical secreted simulium-specific peptide n=1 Tax=Simulium guianense TaxID=445764 RepID=F5GTX5_SIMGU
MRPVLVFAFLCILILIFPENGSANIITSSLAKAIKNASKKASSNGLKKSVVGNYIKRVMKKIRGSFSKAIKASPFQIPNKVAQKSFPKEYVVGRFRVSPAKL